MMTILHRLRGTWAIMAKVNGIILGALFYLFTLDTYTSIALAVAYVAGESMGWGKWIGGLIAGHRVANKYDIENTEGYSNGIHYIANLISPETRDFQKFCFTALAIRGGYWFGVTLLPLVIGGYLPVWGYVIASFLLGIGFPLSVMLGKISKDKFTFKFMFGAWEHGEVWYGVMQDMAILSLIVIMCK